MIVLALGYHFDEGLDGVSKNGGQDSVSKLASHLPLGDRVCEALGDLFGLTIAV